MQAACTREHLARPIVSFPDPTLKEGKGSGTFQAILGFADSTVQDPELPIRFEACDLSCNIG